MVKLSRRLYALISKPFDVPIFMQILICQIEFMVLGIKLLAIIHMASEISYPRAYF